MSVLWLPETAPPQVSEEAQQTVALRLLTEGIVPISRTALSALETTHEPLATYIDRFGFDLNRFSMEGHWPERVLKIGASVGMLAYRETGYFQTVDEDAFALGAAQAIRDGIPEAYLSSRCQDQNLQALMSIVADAHELVEPASDSGGYQQILDIGAGCVRYYMQQSLAA